MVKAGLAERWTKYWWAHGVKIGKTQKLLTALQIYDSSRHSVANLIATSGESKLGSGSGFMTNGSLVTCAHVTHIPKGLLMEVSFEQPAAGASTGWSYGTSIPYKGYSEEHSYDFAILDIPPDQIAGPSLELADRIPAVGEPVCALGYPFEDPHLTIHQGIVSACFESGPATMLKLDMSVNPSNSGGPLVSMLDGKVVGIVARKATGLTQLFQDLMRSFESNITILRSVRGSMTLSGINPFEVLASTQAQMRQISLELERSSNVGIGYAISVNALIREATFNT